MLYRERNYKEWKRVQNKHKSVMNLVKGKQRRIAAESVLKATENKCEQENYRYYRKRKLLKK